MRGGLTDHHQDGWGIAFFEGKGVRQFLDPLPSATSPIAEIVRNYPIKSKNVIAHIRKATQGQVSLENTHPFTRELWGYYWVFAHNGNIPDFNATYTGAFRPVGTTDSEKVFCWMMQELERKYGRNKPTCEELFTTLTELSLEIGSRGEFNFMLSNGEVLYAHCSTRLSYIVRKSPFPSAHLKDQDVTVDFSNITTATDRVAIIATTPLTDDETWTTLEPGTLTMFHEGKISTQSKTIPGPVKSEAS
jgi:Predicted glutamine amidotransferase